MRIEQRTDGTIARILDPVEVNLYARILQMTQQLLRLNAESQTEIAALQSRLAKAEADLLRLKQISAPHLGKFFGALDLLRGNSHSETDPQTGRLVLATTGSGLLAYTQNLLLIPGTWTAMAFVRGPVRFTLRVGVVTIASIDDNGSAWRLVSLPMTVLRSDGELEVQALGAAAIDYIAVRMGD